MRRSHKFRSKEDGAKAPVKPSTSSIVAAPAVSLPAQVASAVLQGLEVVFEGRDPLIDIVAVHGLNGHREKTWTAGNSANSVNWLRDLLPQDLPNARILSWGYDANTHSGSRVNCQYLFDHRPTDTTQSMQLLHKASQSMAAYASYLVSMGTCLWERLYFVVIRPVVLPTP